MTIPEEIQSLTDQFEAFYHNFGAADLARLPELYADEVVFRDPIHQVTGLGALNDYFKSTRQGLNYCYFEFTDALKEEHTVMYQWQMRFSHSSLKRGRELLVPGMTALHLEQRIVRHEDYYDLGAMLYEHVPGIGKLVHWLKGRVSG